MDKKKVYYFACKRVALNGTIHPGQSYNAEYVRGEYLILRRKGVAPEVITEAVRIEHFHGWFSHFEKSKTGEFFPCRGKAMRAFEK